jgi:hypothetical protein
MLLLSALQCPSSKRSNGISVDIHGPDDKGASCLGTEQENKIVTDIDVSRLRIFGASVRDESMRSMCNDGWMNQSG